MKAKEPSATYYTEPKLNALRDRIKKNLDSINNPQDLEHLLALTERQNSPEESVLKLSSEIKSAIQEGLDDYNNGKFIAQKDLNKEFEEWMKEQ